MEASVSASEPTGANAIITERHGDHLLIIRIDRPQRRNGFDSATAHALEAVRQTGRFAIFELGKQH
jgi:hypothetical protein